MSAKFCTQKEHCLHINFWLILFSKCFHWRGPHAFITVQPMFVLVLYKFTRVYNSPLNLNQCCGFASLVLMCGYSGVALKILFTDIKGTLWLTIHLCVDKKQLITTMMLNTRDLQKQCRLHVCKILFFLLIKAEVLT